MAPAPILQSQALPLYTGFISNSRFSSVQATSEVLPNGGVRISSVTRQRRVGEQAD